VGRLARLGFATIGLVPDEEGASALRAEMDRLGLGVEAIVADLGDPAARASVVSDRAPWALVNNAGYMNAGQIQDVNVDDARRQLEVMVVAAADLAQQALPAMLRAGQGRIVNVTSSAVHTSTQLTGWYAACKAALREITDALRLELHDTGVDVVDIEPGGYRTGIWPGAAAELRRRKDGTGRPDLYDRALRCIDRAADRMPDPEEVAGAIGDVLTAGQPPPHVRIGPGARLLRTVDALVPDRIWDGTAAILARTG
jgi:short-subunit dehydrogenase